MPDNQFQEENMEHKTAWERGFGNCAIRICSCGAHYLFIAYQIHYHFVFPVKYRKAIFGRADRERTLFRICKEIEKRYGVEFEQIGVDTNHVHYLLSAAPKYAPSDIARISEEHNGS